MSTNREIAAATVKANLDAIPFVEVESSNVKALYYSADAQDLFIKFKGDSIYVYSEVPADVAAELIAADSIGKFMNAEIKPYYEYNKIN